LVCRRDPRQGGANPRGAHRGREAGRGPRLHGAARRQQESRPNRRDREGAGRGPGGWTRGGSRIPGMKRFATPWMAREALVGFLAGSMAAILCLFVPLDTVVRVLLALALIAAGYL